MARVPLRESAVITLNSSGAGTAKVGPLSPREVWYPSIAQIAVNGPLVSEAICTVYTGRDATLPNRRDATTFGSSGDKTGRIGGYVIRTGEYVWAVWTNGDAGVQASLTVIGMKDV